MAKKKASGNFVMSQAILELLQENSKLSGKEVCGELKKRYPGEKINENSALVAFSNARQKLGLRKSRGKSVRRAKPTATRSVGRPPKAAGSVDLNALQAARKFVAEVGDADKAIAAVRELATLQLNS